MLFSSTKDPETIIIQKYQKYIRSADSGYRSQTGQPELKLLMQELCEQQVTRPCIYPPTHLPHSLQCAPEHVHVFSGSCGVRLQADRRGCVHAASEVLLL